MRNLKTAGMALIFALIHTAAIAQPAGTPILPALSSGFVAWGDWSFAYAVGDDNEEGLMLMDVRWKGVKVLHKASMPVIRVKYRGDGTSLGSGCGPWADQIDWGAIETLNDVPTKVIMRIWGNHLEVAVYAEIGGYFLWQAYVFRTGDAALFPKLYSAGWSCGQSGSKKDHKHHPYWRLDFDVEDHLNEVWQLNTTSNPNEIMIGRFDAEGSSQRTSSQPNKWWRVGKPGSSKSVKVEIISNELRDQAGSPWFEFSRRDASVRRYHADEDEGWDFGAKGNLGYADPAESLTGARDIIFWGIGHLSHFWTAADQANPHWHERTMAIRPNW